jgi:hypothetical protein
MVLPWPVSLFLIQILAVRWNYAREAIRIWMRWHPTLLSVAAAQVEDSSYAVL